MILPETGASPESLFVPSDNSFVVCKNGVCNKGTAFCPWRNKATTVFGDFGGCVTRELLSI